MAAYYNVSGWHYEEIHSKRKTKRSLFEVRNAQSMRSIEPNKLCHKMLLMSDICSLFSIKLIIFYKCGMVFGLRANESMANEKTLKHAQRPLVDL